MKKNILYLYILCLAGALASCSDEVTTHTQGTDNGQPIRVGTAVSGLSIDSDLTPLTRATATTQPAEEVRWLVQPLKEGLDITYGKVADTDAERQERVAILKLTTDGTDYGYQTNAVSGLAEYTFNYRNDDGTESSTPATWKGNGPHYFEGLHVPNRLRYTTDISELATKVPQLTSNQSGDNDTGTDAQLGNYTLLSHYLSMPAHTNISATIERILLPFRHRLAHVLVYIIIDPTFDTSIKGYKRDDDGNPTTEEDPTNTSIRFGNVDVLQGVHDEVSPSGLRTLTPKWKKERKIVPHFWGELAELVIYESEDETIYPQSDRYDDIAANPAAQGFVKKTYTAVPVYDIIIRPTYTSVDDVMYDEEGYSSEATRRDLAALKNNIDFDITLDNGLTYVKSCKIDLNANRETSLYLYISRVGVDYNESGSSVWVETVKTDDPYGVGNDNNLNLSTPGSSWQRAFIVGERPSNDKVTDGGYYDENTPGADPSKVQYLSTSSWINRFAQAHQGGAHHGDYFTLNEDITIDARLLPDDFVFTGHLNGFGTTTKTYHTSTLTNTGQAWTERLEATTKAELNDTVYNYDGSIFSLPTLYRYIMVGDEMQYVEVTDLTVYEMMGPETFYERSGTEEPYTYTAYSKPATLYKAIIQHTSPSSLFGGLDGIYETNQERGATPWEANVHLERTMWLPYRDMDSGTGWRAEVMNLRVAGGSLFRPGAVVTGNVENCSDVNGRVADHRPAIPRY